MLGITGDFYLGQLMGYDDVDVHIDGASKGFLPRNVGVFGTIGSGKSNTVQVVMEQALDAGWAVVVVDVEGEYVRMDEPTDDVALSDLLRRQFHDSARGVSDLRVYVPSSGSTEAVAPVQFKVPIAALETEILTDLLELSEPQARMFGTITANARRTTGATSSATRLGPLASSQGAPATRPFTLQTLIDGLDDSTTPPFALAPNIQQFERPTASVLRSKLINLGRSGVLDWGATNRIAELPVDHLLVGGRLSILDVSETDDRSRSLAIAYLLQSIFQRVVETPVGQPMTGGQIRPRVLVVIEEVHTFVSRANAQRMRAVIDQLQVISRRGRKRWMALALVSQQPGHVPDELFELANTRFIHQLKSAANLAPVQQTTGGVHEALWKIVPTLGQGQALVTGSMLRNPIFINMRPARSRRLLTT
jgi:DNA helicase HerA-like ATPase